MSAYFVFNYTITNAEGYGAYTAAAMPTLADQDVEVLVADYESEAKEGSPGQVTIILRFPSKDAANAWYESDAYKAAMQHRTENTDGSAVLCNGLVMPS